MSDFLHETGVDYFIALIIAGCLFLALGAVLLAPLFGVDWLRQRFGRAARHQRRQGRDLERAYQQWLDEHPEEQEQK